MTKQKTVKRVEPFFLFVNKYGSGYLYTDRSTFKGDNFNKWREELNNGMTETNTTPTPPPTETYCNECKKPLYGTLEQLRGICDSCLTPPPTEGEDSTIHQILLPCELVPDLEAQVTNQIKDIITQALAEQKARMVEVVESLRDSFDFEVDTQHANYVIDQVIKALSK